MSFPQRLLRSPAKFRARLRQRQLALEAAEPAAAEPVAPAEINVHVEERGSAYDSAVPDGLHVAAAWAWRVIVVAMLVLGLGYVVGYLSEVVIPLAVATLLTALLLPVAHRLMRWGVPNGLATPVTVLGGLAIIVGALYLIATQIAGQAGRLSSNVVDGFNQIAAYLQTGPFKINATWFNSDQWVERITAFVSNSQSTIATYAAEIGAQVGHFLAGFAITLFALFYFLHSGREIFSFLLRFFPRRSRNRVDRAASRGWRSLSSYVRATVLVAFTDGLGVLIAALILGVPVAPALAALVFIGAFVPIVGALLSGFVAVLVALVAVGWVKALIMLGAVILIMQIEGHVLQPFLLGRAVRLHPLAVIIAIAVGIILGGIVGALMAVPLLAFSKTFVQYLSTELPNPPTADVRR
jgi:predicted PurR-regulated permease PerM